MSIHKNLCKIEPRKRGAGHGEENGALGLHRALNELRLIDDTFFNAFMEDNAKDMQELAQRARYLKSDEHGVMKMCKMMEEIHEDGRAEGIAETTLKIARNLLSSGKMSYEEIAKNADTSLDEVLRIAKESHLVY